MKQGGGRKGLEKVGGGRNGVKMIGRWEISQCVPLPPKSESRLHVQLNAGQNLNFLQSDHGRWETMALGSGQNYQPRFVALQPLCMGQSHHRVVVFISSWRRVFVASCFCFIVASCFRFVVFISSWRRVFVSSYFCFVVGSSLVSSWCRTR